MPIQTALLGVVPPVLISLTVLLAVWRPWSGSPPSLRWASVGSAFALALAYAVTESLVARHWPGFPPADRHRWLPYLGLAAAVGVALDGPMGRRWSASWVVVTGAFALLRWGQLSSKDSFIAGALWVLLSAGVAGGLIGDANRVGRCGPRFALTWLVAATGAAAVFVQSSEAFFAQMAGVLAAVMGVFAVLAFWRPRLELMPGVAPVFAALHVGLVLCIFTTVESKVLLLLAGLSPAFAGTPLAARLPPWVTTVLCVLIAGALGAAAVWQSPNGFNFGMYGTP
jgi:hypothetical protein